MLLQKIAITDNMYSFIKNITEWVMRKYRKEIEDCYRTCYYLGTAKT